MFSVANMTHESVLTNGQGRWLLPARLHVTRVLQMSSALNPEESTDGGSTLGSGKWLWGSYLKVQSTVRGPEMVTQR